MKPRYTFTKPTRAGMYWYLDGPGSSPKILRVYKDRDGYWSVQYDELQVETNTSLSDYSDDDFSGPGTDFIENYHGAWGMPPITPPEPPPADLWP